MDAAELEAFETQLADTESALRSDPDNADLKALRDELVNLIQLSKSIPTDDANEPPPPPPEPSPPPPPSAPSGSRMYAGPSQRFTVGQQVNALYSDRRWYPARIVSLSGDPANPLCTVVYTGYGNSETLPSSSLKPLPAQPQDPTPPPPPPPSDSALPPPPPPPEPRPPGPLDDKARKKMRTEKKIARREHQSAIAQAKATSWQNFSAKSKSLPKNSMFRTSDDPYARVGISKSPKPP
ncbi:uncharacterized protein PAN0_014c4896 [Moesziomyces antarcticus]|uniref:Related to splicing factor SPF30 n=2 Tax=Pseudozyma antarctica TaxID=84753 RepID=A0A5C3FTT3_PSEA2|nr:uncharacterized protein PAN0_014c4896 [Moesziomyces antarcticus]GAK66673.1 conserved hypothetical protein [Moesziomyces antarcticus]SPO47722.1 related to splicing factor SPF30 [Moesziomyces antarcticus]